MTEVVPNVQIASDVVAQDGRLLSIIERQRLVIKKLEKDLAAMTADRDDLLNRNRAWEKEYCDLNASLERVNTSQLPSLPIQPSKSVPHRLVFVQPTLNIEKLDPPTSPVLPPRSPFRQNLRDTVAKQAILSHHSDPIISGPLCMSKSYEPRPLPRITPISAMPIGIMIGNKSPTSPGTLPDGISKRTSPIHNRVSAYDRSNASNIPKAIRHSISRNSASSKNIFSLDGPAEDEKFSSLMAHNKPAEYENVSSRSTSQYVSCLRKYSLTEDYTDPGKGLRRVFSQPQLATPMCYDTKESGFHATSSDEEIPPYTNTEPSLRVFVVGSNIITNERGKKLVSFIISVGQIREASREVTELWRIEKLYSDFLALDAQLRGQGRARNEKIGKLPEKGLFTTHAPSKVDKRKIAVEKYLQNAVNMKLSESPDLRLFLNSNIVKTDQQTTQLPGCKQGYLTKRGKNFGGWKTRYFILDGSKLQYYENKGGSLLGVIHVPDILIESQISKLSIETNEYNMFRHCFVLLERRKASSNGVHRHILCAESDTERDEWLKALNQNENYSHADNDGCDTNMMANTQHFPRRSENMCPPKDCVDFIRPNFKESTVEYEKDHHKSFVGSERNSSAAHRPLRSNSDTSVVLGEFGQTSLPSAYSTKPFGNNIVDKSIFQRTSMDQTNNIHSKDNPQSQEHVSIRQASTESFFCPPYTEQKKVSTEQEYYDIDGKKTKQKSNRRTFWAKKIFTGSADSQTKSGSSAPTSTPLMNGPIAFRAFLSRNLSDPTETTTGELVSKQGGRNQTKVSLDNVSKQVFGVPLLNAVEISKVSDTYRLPLVVYRCIEYLESKKAIFEEGIYRLSGSTVKIRALKTRFNEKGDIDFIGLNEFHDIHGIAGLLKLWLRELPCHVFTNELLPNFVSVIDLVDRPERVNELQRLVSMLPIENYTLLRTLTAHLIRVVQNSDTNRMTLHNIGIVFSPTLKIPVGIFFLFIYEFDTIFSTKKKTISKVESTNYFPQYTGTIHPTQAGFTLPASQAIPIIQTQDDNFISEDHKLLNRNSMAYMDSAPSSIMGLEEHTDVSASIEDEEEEEEEVGDLCIRNEYEDYSDTDDEEYHTPISAFTK